MLIDSLLSGSLNEGSSLQTKILQTPAELVAFRDLYNANLTVNAELSYLLTADKVRVFYENDGEWLAGYVINSRKPLRYLDVFDAQTKRVIFRDCGHSEEDFAEITCIWINPALTRTNKGFRLAVYEYSVIDAAKSGKRFIMGGSKILTVWKTFEIILPKVMYFGLVSFPNTYTMGKIVYELAENAQQNFEDYLVDHNA